MQRELHFVMNLYYNICGLGDQDISPYRQAQIYGQNSVCK